MGIGVLQIVIVQMQDSVTGKVAHDRNRFSRVYEFPPFLFTLMMLPDELLV